MTLPAIFHVAMWLVMENDVVDLTVDGSTDSEDVESY